MEKNEVAATLSDPHQIGFFASLISSTLECLFQCSIADENEYDCVVVGMFRNT